MQRSVLPEQAGERAHPEVAGEGAAHHQPTSQRLAAQTAEVAEVGQQAQILAQVCLAATAPTELVRQIEGAMVAGYYQTAVERACYECLVTSQVRLRCHCLLLSP